MPVFRAVRRIEFGDTDMAGIVHFANFFRYMEAAEHAFLRACGLTVVFDWGGDHVSLPRVSASCDFLKPVTFQDVLEIEVTLERLGKSSIAYAFTFRKQADEIARGKITAVLCRILPERKLEAFPFPDSLRQLLERGPLEENT